MSGALPAYRYRDPADVVDQMRAEERRRIERLKTRAERAAARPPKRDTTLTATNTTLTEEDLKYVPKNWLR